MPAVLENAYPWSPPGDSAAKLRKIWALEPCCCRKTLWLPFPQLPTWQGCQTPAPSLSTPVSIPTISPCSQGFLSYFIFTPSPPARSFLRFCKKKKKSLQKTSFLCLYNFNPTDSLHIHCVHGLWLFSWQQPLSMLRLLPLLPQDQNQPHLDACSACKLTTQAASRREPGEEDHLTGAAEAAPTD